MSTERGLVMASGMAWSNVSRLWFMSRLWLSSVGCPSSPAATLRKCMSRSVLNTPAYIYACQCLFLNVSVLARFLYQVTIDMYVCVCVCVCARARACVYAYIYTSIYLSIYIHILSNRDLTHCGGLGMCVSKCTRVLTFENVCQ